MYARGQSVGGLASRGGGVYFPSLSLRYLNGLIFLCLLTNFLNALRFYPYLLRTPRAERLLDLLDFGLGGEMSLPASLLGQPTTL